MPKFLSAVSRRRRFSSLIAALALVAFAAACDSSTGNDDKIAALTVNPPTPVLGIGSVQQLIATPTTTGGRIIEGVATTWSTSNAAVASVSSTGLVTAVSGGTATITATAAGKSADAAVEVWFPVQTVTLASAGAATTIKQEGSLQLTPSFTANGAAAPGRQVVWTTSDATIATVTTTGRIIGQQTDGVATITATSEGVAGTFVITVAGPPDVATVTMAATLGRHMAPAMTDQFIVKAFAPSGRELDLGTRTVVWTSATPASATVSATGLVTMIADDGQSVIKATVDGVNPTATLTAVGRPTLALGPTVIGSIAAGARQDWVIDIPAGTTNLTVTLAGGTGDPDLFLYRPAKTSANPVLGCVSGASGPAEACSVDDPTVGRWFIQVEAWSGAGAAAGTTINATRTP